MHLPVNRGCWGNRIYVDYLRCRQTLRYYLSSSGTRARSGYSYYCWWFSTTFSYLWSLKEYTTTLYARFLALCPIYLESRVIQDNQDLRTLHGETRAWLILKWTPTERKLESDTSTGDVLGVKVKSFQTRATARATGTGSTRGESFQARSSDSDGQRELSIRDLIFSRHSYVARNVTQIRAQVRHLVHLVQKNRPYTCKLCNNAFWEQQIY